LQMAPWNRYATDGKDHPHVFVGGGPGKPFTRVAMTRDETEISSGIRDLLLLKSTASAFKGFPRDEFTTLPETGDRILSTSMEAAWTFTDRKVDFTATNHAVIAALLKTFATEFSPSVQNTLYLMGQAALAVAPTITTISIAMPNKHYLPIDLKPFDLSNANDIFLPTDEPHGQIEACIRRSSS
jgi:urate oxidase